MGDSFFVAFRECLEAALVVGIILVYLNQTNRQSLTKYVALGTLTGMTLSILIGVGLFIGLGELQEETEEIVENIMRLTAAGLIFYFVIWMSQQRKYMSQQIKERIDKSSDKLSLFFLAFISVFREGLELVIFLLTKIDAKATMIVSATSLGMVAAIILTYLLFKTSVTFNLKFIFTVLSVILVWIGGEMFAEGIVGIVGAEGLLEEVVEITSLILFIGISLYLLFKEEIHQRFSASA